jgi:hypothetical protein
MLQKLEFRPGVNRESTTYANEGGFYASDKIRFRSGFAEKLGGWINYSVGYTFKGVARSMWNWVTAFGENLLGLGTNQKFYVEQGGQYYDITPLRTTVTLPTDPFTTTNGAKLVVVNATSHNATIGSFVTYSGATAVGGLTLNGEYEIVSVGGTNTYSIASATAATSSATGGGASVVAAYQLNAGNSVYTTGVGWGGPPWGGGGWGSAIPAGTPLRLWSQTNYNDDLLFAEREENIYYWTKDTSTWARAVTLQDKCNTQAKTTTTATFGSGVTTITVPDTTGINTGSVISGTNIVAGTYVTTAWTGGTSVPISAATLGVSSGSYTFSYAGRHAPNETEAIISSSVNDFIICLGSKPYDPTSFSTTFDPMLVRWSDQDNPFEWVPETTNQSGEQVLSVGSYIVQAQVTRQEVLIWTDAALYSMQYLGPPYVFGINLLMDNISIASPNSAITINNVTYWMGRDKFYMYTGRVETLPCSLRQYIFQNINKDQINQIVCGANEGYNEIWWLYPSGTSLINDSYVIYNHLERIWYYGTLNRTFWLDSPLRQYPMAAYSIQSSYLSTDISSSDTSITLVNGNTYPPVGTIVIESEQITYTGLSGNVLTGCVRGANNTTAASHVAYTPVTNLVPNQVMYHEFGNDDQSTTTPQPIAAYIESADFDIGDGHNFGFVWRILPDLTFSGSSANSPAVMLTVKPRQNSGSNYTAADSPTVTRTATYPVEQYTGQVYTRIRGRQMAFRIDSTDLGVAWQLGAMRLDLRPDGRR